MTKNYNYLGKKRKEVWLSESALRKLTKQAKEMKRKLKNHLEFILENH